MVNFPFLPHRFYIDLNVSMKGMVKGTPGYIAPEILNDGEYTFKSDIFAIGAILHKILTNELPFKGSSANEVLENTKLGKFQTFSQTDQSIPESLKAICQKSLELKSDNRYNSVKDLLDDLKAYQSGFATKAENCFQDL